MANNEYVNEVKYGNQTIISLKEDTVTPQTLMRGETAHDRSGAPIVGTATGGGAAELNDLDDVTVTSPSNGDILRYDSSDEQWKNESLGVATTSTDGLMSSSDKTKLNGVATGAEVNVQSDWSVTDSSSDAFIKNKPTIPAAQVNADWNASSGVAQILNKPTIPAEQIQADWNQTTTTAKDYIKNKPTIPDTSVFMTKANPTGTGFFSLNRVSGSTVGDYSFAEGSDTVASGVGSHAEGGGTTASNTFAHAEGGNTTASGGDAHAEGYNTSASGSYTHAEGRSTSASGNSSHAEGYGTTASGKYSHAEGYYTEAKTGDGAHAEGCGYSSTYKVIASGKGSHAEGEASSSKSVTASGEASHAEGYTTTASGATAHAEGENTTASGGSSHAEGYYTIASAGSSHAEGKYTEANTGEGAHAEGCGYSSTYKVVASGMGAHAEGVATSSKSVTASGQASHAEGQVTTASGAYGSHAEGYDTTASGETSHAEGYNTKASGSRSHAEGSGTTASGEYAHAEGRNTTAWGSYSHAEGYYTNAAYIYQHVSGKYNSNKSDTLLEIGNGTSSARSNAFEVYSDASLSTDNGTNRTKLPIVKQATLAASSTTVSFSCPSGGTDVLTYPAQSSAVTVYAVYTPIIVANGTSVSDYIASFYTSVPGLDYTNIGHSTTSIGA